MVWAFPFSLATTKGIVFTFFSSGYWDVSLHRVLLAWIYIFNPPLPTIKSVGFPHSEISGSKPVNGSPKLIAVYHVLHRLVSPRHSLAALYFLIISLSFNFTIVLNFLWRVLFPTIHQAVKEQKLLDFRFFIFLFDHLKWWAQVDLNHRPHAYQACALTSWAMSPLKNKY